MRGIQNIVVRECLGEFDLSNVKIVIEIHNNTISLIFHFFCALARCFDLITSLLFFIVYREVTFLEQQWR